MTFENQLICEYLKYESIESVFKKHRYNLPISFAGFARLLNKTGIVTTAGPNSHLSESLYFFSLLKEYGGSIGKLHQKLGVKISTQTLHRVLHNIRFGITRRYGAALIIEDTNTPGIFLLAQDSSLRGQLGQRGDWTLPMGHTRQQDSHYTSILRVLQREVFTEQTINQSFPYNILRQNLSPVFNIDITDISVRVYRLKLDLSEYKYTSFKLFNHQAFDTQEIISLKTRPGVKEIIDNFTLQSAKCNLSSNLNSELQEAYMLK